jgi:hypothetical protein
MNRSCRDADINPNFDEYGLPALPPLKDPFEWVPQSYLDKIENRAWRRGFIWGTNFGLILSGLILIAAICYWGVLEMAHQRDVMFQRLTAPPAVHPTAIPQLRKD